MSFLSSIVFWVQSPFSINSVYAWKHGRRWVQWSPLRGYQPSPVCLCAIPRSEVGQQLHTLLFSPSWQSPQSLLGFQMRNTGNLFLPKSSALPQSEQNRLANTWSVHVRLHNNVHTPNTVKLDFLILVVTPVSHFSQIRTTCFELLVAYFQLDPVGSI